MDKTFAGPPVLMEKANVSALTARDALVESRVNLSRQTKKENALGFVQLVVISADPMGTEVAPVDLSARTLFPLVGKISVLVSAPVMCHPMHGKFYSE